MSPFGFTSLIAGEVPVPQPINVLWFGSLRASPIAIENDRGSLLYSHTRKASLFSSSSWYSAILVKRGECKLPLSKTVMFPFSKRLISCWCENPIGSFIKVNWLFLQYSPPNRQIISPVCLLIFVTSSICRQDNKRLPSLSTSIALPCA